MDLFNAGGSPANLLPEGGEVLYYGKVFDRAASDQLAGRLLHEIDWRHDEAVIFGNRITTKRKVAWYGDQPFPYTYSRVTKTALAWTPMLLELRAVAEQHTAETYNSCLLNLYHTGEEGMAWHSDGEKDLRRNGAIASLSFGAERRFCFKHKQTGKTICLPLEHGSLLVMKGETQTNWLHRLPPVKGIRQPRINLTFRTIVAGQSSRG